MARAYNLSQRLVIDNDGELCRITNMYDAEGDETTDLDAVCVVVAKRSEGEWLTVRVNEENDVPFGAPT